MPVAEPQDAVVIGDQWAGKFDGGGDQQSVGRIAMFKMVKGISLCSGASIKRGRFDPRTVEKASNPGFDRDIDLDPAAIDQQGHSHAVTALK